MFQAGPLHSAAVVTAVGSYVPERVLTNADLERLVDTSDEWIVQRTGIKERRIAREDEYCSDLCIAAARDLARRFAVDLSDVDYILTATSSPETVFPSMSARAQAALGIRAAGAADVQAACAGFVSALQLANGLILSGLHRKVLVIGATGLGQRNHAFHAQAIEAGAVDVILTYKDYNPIRTTADDLLDLAARHDVGVMNGSPFAMGLLSGASPDELPERVKQVSDGRDLDAAGRLSEWCRAKQLNESAVVLQFSLRQPRIQTTVIGAERREEVARDLKAALEPLPDEIWNELESLHLTAGQTQPE